MAWSPDGKKLAAGHWPNPVIWDEKGHELTSLVGDASFLRSSVLTMAWSPDGNFLATAGIDQTVTIWHSNSGKEDRKIQVHKHPIRRVHYSPDGRNLLSVAGDVRISRATEDVPIATRWKVSSDEIYTIAWSPDGKRLISGGADRFVRVHDANTGAIRQEWSSNRGEYVSAVRFRPNSEEVFSMYWAGPCIAWRPGADQPVHTLATLWQDSGISNALAWSSNGKRLALISDGKLLLYDGVLSKPPLTIETSIRQSWCLAWNPEGTRLAVGGFDGVIIANAADGQQLFHLRCGPVRHHGLAWSPDGRTVAAGNEFGSIFYFNAGDGRLIRQANAHKSIVMGLEWNQNGKRIASVEEGGVVKIWNAATGENLVTLRIGVRVSGMKWRPDGWRLACGERENGLICILGSPEIDVIR